MYKQNNAASQMNHESHDLNWGGNKDINTLATSLYPRYQSGLSVPLMHHDPSDLGSLIQITPAKEGTYLGTHKKQGGYWSLEC